MTVSQRRWCRASFLALLVPLASFAGRLAAQSEGDLAAWDALTLSTVGALPPLVLGGDENGAWQNQVSIRFGYWRYDVNDVAHNNFGVTLVHAFDGLHTEVALTGVYLRVACGDCDDWQLGGVDVQSTLATHDVGGSAARPVAVTVGVRESVGGARYAGPDYSVSLSAAAAMALGVDVPFVRGSYLHASLLPGMGVGWFRSPDLNDQGARPTLGAGLAWAFASGLVLSGGFQRIIMSGAPPDIGLSVSWGFGHVSRAGGG